MGKPVVFIDGEHGTTGLQIRDRLARRDDIKVLSVPAADRRDAVARARALNQADVAILCLPDDASRQAVAMLAEAGNQTTRVIDTSTAHRRLAGWVYGFAELASGQREAIAGARFVANPGCYSTGAIALLRPLVDAGLVRPEHPVTINAVSGYTGGGKGLIAQMENGALPDHITSAHYLYALGLTHKHVPEIMAHSGLSRRPVFTPNVGRFAQGMLVNIPLHLDLLTGSPSPTEIHGVLEKHYRGQQWVQVATIGDAKKRARIEAEELAGKDSMLLFVLAGENGDIVNLVASLDNLGKGASGAAVQNMDLMLGR